MINVLLSGKYVIELVVVDVDQKNTIFLGFFFNFPISSVVLFWKLQGYIVLNRPWAFVQWLQQADIKEEYGDRDRHTLTFLAYDLHIF